MGLDMYLSGREFISRYEYNDYDVKKETRAFGEIMANFNVEPDPSGFAGLEISIPMGYWRKVNHIHNWFVQNHANGLDECQKIYVSRSDLQCLLDCCDAVLAMRGTAVGEQVAKDVLPPSAGFFFGTYEIDEWYYHGIEQTVEIINRCLASKFDSFEYQASW